LSTKSREKEYKEIFLAESLEEFDAINRHLTELEKNPGDERLLGEVFRLLHNLKANAKAAGYLNISQLAHKVENVFGALRNKDLTFEGKVVSVIFEAVDSLGLMLKYIDQPEKEPFDPILEKNLEIILSPVSHNLIEDKNIKHYHTAQNITLSDLIYIPIRKLDDLMNLVGELIIDRDRVVSITSSYEDPALKLISSHLYRITNEIQQAVIDARLVSIGFLFNKFPRIARDIASVENKSIDLDIQGEDIQIDRNILQILTDSILHLVRNAITHGIESTATRKKNKKNPTGHITLTAQNDKDTVLIQISDDGQGIDENQVREHAIDQRFISPDKASELNKKEMLAFIFEPGFSLSKQITEFSGRGVGLDVVKTAIDSLGGRLSVDSTVGEGTTFNLYVPTSIAVKGSLLFEIENNSFAIPLIHTDAVVTLTQDQVHQVGNAIVADIKGETLPLIDLKDLFQERGIVKTSKYKQVFNNIIYVIIVSYNNRQLGLIVDKLIRQQDIVVKPLQKPVDNIDIFGGVTLLGNGEVCLVLDIPTISRNFILRKKEMAALLQ
jgi:two-component system, chemotaxis family, sensor kinase CheA